MRILLLGGGGREHAFAWKISQSKLCSKLYIAPGNAGTIGIGENIALDIEDNESIYELVVEKSLDMVIVGPEAPLVNGIWNYLKRMRSTSHVAVIGPSMQGARLEGSKAYAKRFMQEFGIPTADYRQFARGKTRGALSYIRNSATLPIVLKADGLAAGKGVVICETREEALREAQEMFFGKFGPAGNKVVVEQFLSGIEFSVFVLTDGKSYKILPTAKDYKRIGEGDTGLNTGGMGAVSPPPFVDASLMEKVEERIIKPSIYGIQKRRIHYQGFIFFGLIKVGSDPYVIEYNCRMGDPETEVVLPRIKTDFVEMMKAVTESRLHEVEIEVDPRAATTIILASGGYPGAYEKGKIISGLDKTSGSLIFHAGTISEGQGILSSGGRVIAVTSLGNDFREALAISNTNAALINFEGKYYRRDIGFDL